MTAIGWSERASGTSLAIHEAWVQSAAAAAEAPSLARLVRIGAVDAAAVPDAVVLSSTRCGVFAHGP
jgi:hypothetical protein